MTLKLFPLAPVALSLLLPGCGTTGGGDDSTGAGPTGTPGPGSTTGDSNSTSGSTTTTTTTTTTDTTTTSASGGVTTTPTSDSSTSSGSGGSTSGSDPTTGGTGGSFVAEPDAGDSNECDPRTQDCPDGEKCTAWADDGGNAWNANKCVPATGNNQPGDPCQIEGSGVAGFDDCAPGGICLFTDQDGIGLCLAFCEGAEEMCPGLDPCIVTNDGTLPICLQACDPLLQDCLGAQGCYDSPVGLFGCFSDSSGSGGFDGDPCPPSDGENGCDPGHWCGPGSSGCSAVNCCTPYCDLSAPNCSSPDQCISYYGDVGSAPPGLEDVGVCILP